MTSKTIACLAWGSLVWDPRALPISSPWKNDGPSLPVEFARQSNDDRITLVLSDASPLVPTLWAPLRVTELAAAVTDLAARENISARIEHNIGAFSTYDQSDFQRRSSHWHAVRDWALKQGLDAVVWTNLRCGMKGSMGIMPSLETVLSHLAGLDQEKARVARQYVVNTPAQIDTPYRRAIAKELGWA